MTSRLGFYRRADNPNEHPLFIMQTKFAPPIMTPTKLKPYHFKNLTALNTATAKFF